MTKDQSSEDEEMDSSSSSEVSGAPDNMRSCSSTLPPEVRKDEIPDLLSALGMRGNRLRGITANRRSLGMSRAAYGTNSHHIADLAPFDG